MTRGDNATLSGFGVTGSGRVFISTSHNLVEDVVVTGVDHSYIASFMVYAYNEVIEDVAPTLKEKRFGIEAELTAKVARRNYRIYEMGVTYFGRTYGEGKKIGLRDAFRAFWCILRYWKLD